MIRGEVLVRQGTDEPPGPARGAYEGPVQATMLGDQIKDHLLALILAGEFAPGARIVETRVARDLGVSQGPVREALRDLATLGLVELQAYRGARVRRPATEEIQEAMRVRAELEALAAAEACGRRGLGDLSEMRAILAEMVDLAASGQMEAYVRRNTEFHRAVVRTSGNRTLERLWELLLPFARTYLTAAASGLDAGRIRRSHERILRALASGDPEVAARAMRDHSREAQELVTQRDSGSGGGGVGPGGKRVGASRAGRRVT